MTDVSVCNADPYIFVQHLLFLLFAVIIIILSFYWLYSRRRHVQRGNIDAANSSFLYVYRQLIYVYVTVVCIQFLLLLTITALPILIGVENNKYMDTILYALIYTLSFFVYALGLFLYTKNTLSQRAFSRALRIAIPYSIFVLSFALLKELSTSRFAAVCTVFILVLYVLLLFACLLLLIRQCSYHWQRKAIINRYALFLIVLCLLNIAVEVASFEGLQSVECILRHSHWYIYYLLYPLLLFKTIRDDSMYWWTTSSRPLLHSTKESLATIDLFALPPYHDVHFDNHSNVKSDGEDDEQEDDELTQRFNKLSQIVSANVPLIAFNKIKPVKHQMSSGSLVLGTGSSTIGKGSTSKVYRAKWKKHDVAVKQLHGLNWTDLTLIFRESLLSATIEHPNIVKFHGVSLTKDSFYLLNEYCLYGDLSHILIENAYPDNPNISSIYQRLYYLFDIAQGMKHLHEHNFIHRDLKTANVCVTYSTYSTTSNKQSRYIAKICDFGVSRRVSAHHQRLYSQPLAQSEHVQQHKNEQDDIVDVIDKQQTTDFDESELSAYFSEIERTIDVGTPAFLAPEILLELVKKKGFKFSFQSSESAASDPLIASDFATDVYSYGMIVYTLVTKRLPYKGYKPVDMIMMIKRSERLSVTEQEWQNWVPYVSNIKHLQLLLSSTWSQHPTQRPSFEQICKLLSQLAHDQFS